MRHFGEQVRGQKSLRGKLGKIVIELLARIAFSAFFMLGVGAVDVLRRVLFSIIPVRFLWSFQPARFGARAALSPEGFFKHRQADARTDWPHQRRGLGPARVIDLDFGRRQGALIFDVSAAIELEIRDSLAREQLSYQSDV